MSAILTAFGIDWRLLIIDAVNFGLLLFALWYFLYEPLTKVMQERQQKVAQGVIDAELAKKHLGEIEASRSEKLSQAGKEADEVLARARTTAGVKERELVAAGEAAAARIVAEAEAQAKEAKDKALAESKQEVGKLIVLGIEKALREKA